jgi:hypothetical protein
MNNGQLISKLAMDIKPVKVLRSPYHSLLRWLGLSFLWLILGIMLLGVRKDIGYIFKDATFILYFFILLGLAITSAYSSLSFSIPDKQERILYWLPFSILASWILLLIFSLNELTSSIFKEGLMCVRDILIFTSAPVILLFNRVKQGSVLQTTVTGILCLLGSGGLGALATQFTCQDSFGFHHLIWHVPPIMVLGFLGIFIGKKLETF